MEDAKLPEGTPISKELLLLEGFTDHLASISQEEADAEEDPFYFNKGNFRLFDVIGDFYYCGVRISTMEQVKELYQRETGRTYTTDQVMEDTKPVELNGIVIPPRISKVLVKARLKGGPGDGLTVQWPKASAFYVHQYTENNVTYGAKYKRKPGTKTIFNYIGHTN